MDRFPQPPDPPEEGNCRRCKAWITRDELLIDGCTECDDLLIDDMAKLWSGRPKSNGRYPFKAYVTNLGGPMVDTYVDRPIDWRGLI